MEEIFVGLSIDNKIEIPSFEFFRALSHVIKSIETIAQKEETFKQAFRAAKLEGIYNALQKRDQEVNLTFARFKYLHLLSRHNNRLQFTGIPDPKEKKDIGLPEVFVMQRASESVPGEDYRQLVREHEGDETFSGDEVHLRRMMPVHREETRPAVKFNRVLEESDNRRFVVLYFYHCRYFVMKFIAEQGQWLDNKEFVEKQVDDFFKFSWNEGEDRSLYNNYTWKRFKNWLSSVSDSPAGVYLYKKLLSAAEDQTQSVYLRRDCASAVGQLGHKEKAVDILADLYLAQPDKTKDDARRIYDSLWELTVV